MRKYVTLLILGVAACSANSSNKKKGDGDVCVSDCGSTNNGNNTTGTNSATSGGTDNASNNGSNNDAMALPDRCVESTAWAPGTPVFRDATEASGLEAIGATGIRIATGDIDQDGYPDLAIRRPGSDNFDTGERAIWLLRNRGDGTFEDVTQESGVANARFVENPAIGRPAEVWAFADVDNDGELDIFTGQSGDGSSGEGNEIMLNTGDGTFEFGPSGTPFQRAGEPSSVGGATWVDANRDGLIDLWIGHGAVGGELAADALYLQQPDGSFEDVTEAVGLQTEAWTLQALNEGIAHTNAWSSAACDLDGDGNPELLASSYGRSPNKLWHANFDGESVSYENHSVASGYAFDDRTDWTDNESARCWCTLHPDAEDCEGVPAPEVIPCQQDSDAFRWNHARDREPYRLGGNSGTTVCGDIDNDGHLDLLTTEIVHWDVGSSSDPSELLFNDGASPPTFDRPGNEATGLVRSRDSARWDDGDITGALFDFDNDGRLDVYIGSTDYPGTRAWLFHQKEDGTFQAVPTEDAFAHSRAHGIAVADFDRDGDLDIVIGHSPARCDIGGDCPESRHVRYYENVYGQDGNWVQIQLVGGEGTNRSAIGARLTLESSVGSQTREVDGGHGHYGIQHDLRQHFGLGEDCEAELTVRWPNAEGTEQMFMVQSGYSYRLVEGESPEVLNLDREAD